MSPRYTAEKREALESFLAFSRGGPSPAWPLEVFIEVSNICDLQCAMCPTFSALNPERFFALKREDRGVIAYETATAPLESILQHALVIHASGYGEPTIHPQYRELLAYLSRYEALIDFFTNGMHLDEELCRFLVERRIQRIAISFSGTTAEEYENIYIGGDFERVLGGIRRLRAARDAAGSRYPRIEINSLAFRHHVARLPAFVELMADAGADVIHLKPMRVYENNIPELKHHDSHMHPGREDDIVRRAQEVAQQRGIHLASAPYEATRKYAMNYTRAFEAMPDEERQALFARILEEVVPVGEIKQIALSAAKREAKKEQLASGRAAAPRKPLQLDNKDFMPFRGTPCFEPFKTLYATFDGRVRTCCFAESKDWIGHLSEQDGQSIWQGEAYERLRNQASQGRYLRAMCQQCLKKRAYPKQHDVQVKFRSYARWYRDVFGLDFLPECRVAIESLPDNAGILAHHQVCS